MKKKKEYQMDTKSGFTQWFQFATGEETGLLPNKNANNNRQFTRIYIYI